MRRAGSSPLPSRAPTAAGRPASLASLASPAPSAGGSPRWKLAFFALVALYLLAAAGSWLSWPPVPRPAPASPSAPVAAVAASPARPPADPRAEPAAEPEAQELAPAPAAAPPRERAPGDAEAHAAAVAAAAAEAARMAGDAAADPAADPAAGGPTHLLPLEELARLVQPASEAGAASPALRTLSLLRDPAGDAAVAEAMALVRNPAARARWGAGELEAEAARLQALEAAARAQAARLQTVAAAARALAAEERVELEELAARGALDLRAERPRALRPRLECLGWRQTGGCSPRGRREPSEDKHCAQLVAGGVSGYCELLDRAAGARVRAMQLNCSSLRPHVSFSCAQAADFANFAAMSEDVARKARAAPAGSLQGQQGDGDGIVMVVYPKLMTSAFATVARLRRDLGCALPVELWASEAELARAPAMGAALARLAARFPRVRVRRIADPGVFGFNTKIHALYHSAFARALFLDADNAPARDPAFLFGAREFLDTGALFWPDFWHPRRTIFNIHEHSLLWELVGLDPVDMFEQESGQLLVDRARAAVALEVLMFYQHHRPSHFDKLVLAHGDKDLFRLAWLKTDTPFHMLRFPPGAAGPARRNAAGTADVFCGMTMVQFGPDGRELFLHRNARKLLGKRDHPDGEFWDFVQRFDWRRAPNDSAPMDYAALTAEGAYAVGIHSSAPLFKEFESCYGAEPDVEHRFNLTRVRDLPFRDMERKLVQYAQEAAELAEQDVGGGGGDKDAAAAVHRHQ